MAEKDFFRRLEKALRAAALAFVIWLIPEHQYRNLAGDLGEQNLSFTILLKKGVLWTFISTVGQIVPAFKLPLNTLETAVMALSFAFVPIDQAFYLAVSAGMLGMMLRDAYIFPNVRGMINQGVDAFCGLFFLFGVEVFEHLVSPAHALPWKSLFEGLTAAFLGISMVRIVFRRPDDEKPTYQTTLAVTALWMFAAIAHKGFTRVPNFFLFQDNVFMGAPMWLWIGAFTVGKNRLEGGLSTPIGLFTKNKLMMRIEQVLVFIWTPPTSKKEQIVSTLLLSLAFVAYGLPQILVLSNWALGNTPTAIVDWPSLASGLTAWLSLSAIWFYVRYAHANIAVELNAQKGGIQAS